MRTTPQQAAGGLDWGGLLGALLGGSAGAELVGAVSGGGAQTDGAGILGHILGNNLSKAENSLGQTTGLSADGIQKLLLLLAPIVMCYLGKQFAQGNANSPDVLGPMLGQERAQIQQQGGLAGGLLTSVLDQDGAGKLDLGDLLKFGAGFLNKR